jgi:hypothetical protein
VPVEEEEEYCILYVQTGFFTIKVACIERNVHQNVLEIKDIEIFIRSNL